MPSEVALVLVVIAHWLIIPLIAGIAFFALAFLLQGKHL